MKADRGGGKGKPIPCKHRDRPTSESLALFQDMRNRTRPELTRDCVLRTKQDLEDPNTQMWDLVAYRTASAVHYRTGNEWNVFPT
jgi:glutaminyl-tRNA synthetase